MAPPPAPREALPKGRNGRRRVLSGGDGPTKRTELVIETAYYVHYTHGEPAARPTMRVEYRGGFSRWHREWVCIEHDGYARRKAEHWWRARSVEPFPGSVEEAVELARAGAYDNVCFHRVIDGFMAQTGDVANGNMEKDFNIGRAGTGGSDMPDLPAEFSKIPHARGSLGAARSQNPNSANSQFFINFKDNDFLNGQYTVYGQVISGMDYVDAITRGEPPMNPDRMISVKVAADA